MKLQAPATWADLGFGDIKPRPAKPAAELTAELVRARFRYEPETGALYRADSGPGAAQVEGFTNAKGYRRVWVAGRLHAVHRIAWLWVHGELPRGQIDHINRKRDDNRIANLRDVAVSMNSWNRGLVAPGSSSGFIGVVWNHGKWAAQITANGRRVHLGRFVDKDAAAAAYLKAKQELHPGYVPAALQEALA